MEVLALRVVNPGSPMSHKKEIEDINRKLADIDRETIYLSAGADVQRLRSILGRAEGLKKPLLGRIRQLKKVAP